MSPQSFREQTFLKMDHLDYFHLESNHERMNQMLILIGDLKMLLFFVLSNASFF